MSISRRSILKGIIGSVGAFLPISQIFGKEVKPNKNGNIYSKSVTYSDPKIGVESAIRSAVLNPPGTICSLCGSEDVDIVNGEFHCNKCGAEYGVRVEFKVTQWPPSSPPQILEGEQIFAPTFEFADKVQIKISEIKGRRFHIVERKTNIFKALIEAAEHHNPKLKSRPDWPPIF